MKEVNPEKGLQDYTDAEFDQALSDGEARQAGQPVAEATGLSPEQAQEITTITLMRIYDMLGAILNRLDPEQAEALLDAHADGKLVGPLPYLNI